jgi:hypothetical protein
MKVIKLNKHEKTFGRMKNDMRPFEQAWREDFPHSFSNRKLNQVDWNGLTVQELIKRSNCI